MHHGTLNPLWKIWENFYIFFFQQMWNCLIYKVGFILNNSIPLTLSILTSSGENWSFHKWTSLQNMLYGPQQFCFLSRPYRESSSYVIPMSSCQWIRKFIDQSILFIDITCICNAAGKNPFLCIKFKVYDY